jgi:flagellar protein FlaH
MGNDGGDRFDVISTGNHQLDTLLGGGIPVPSLVLIEGDNSAGKSALSQQLIWGGLRDGYRFTVVTTENTVKSFLSQMAALSLDVTHYFLAGRLRVVPIHVKGVQWDTARLQRIQRILLNFILSDRSQVFVVDSLTYLIAEAKLEDVFTFFSKLKKITEPRIGGSKTIVAVIHSSLTKANSHFTQIRAMCDAHILLNMQISGSSITRSLEVTKLKGASLMTNRVGKIEVHPAFGVRVVPIAEAQA